MSDLCADVRRAIAQDHGVKRCPHCGGKYTIEQGSRIDGNKTKILIVHYAGIDRKLLDRDLMLTDAPAEQGALFCASLGNYPELLSPNRGIGEGKKRPVGRGKGRRVRIADLGN